MIQIAAGALFIIAGVVFIIFRKRLTDRTAPVERLHLNQEGFGTVYLWSGIVLVLLGLYLILDLFLIPG
jgi:hypothetical protein